MDIIFTDPDTPSVFNDAFLASLSIEERNAWLKDFNDDAEEFFRRNQDDPYYLAILRLERAGVA